MHWGTTVQGKQYLPNGKLKSAMKILAFFFFLNNKKSGSITFWQNFFQTKTEPKSHFSIVLIYFHVQFRLNKQYIQDLAFR